MKSAALISHLSCEIVKRFIWDTTVGYAITEAQVLKFLNITLSIHQVLEVAKLLTEGANFEKLYEMAVRGIKINNDNYKDFNLLGDEDI